MAAGETAVPHLISALAVMDFAAFAFMLLRFGSKWKGRTRASFEDFILAASWILLVVYTGVIISATNYGVGRHFGELQKGQTTEAYKRVAIADFFAIVSLAVSKSSFAVTLLRLTSSRLHKGIIWFIIVTTNLSLWLSASLIFAMCTPVERIWDRRVPGTCLNIRMVVNYALFSGSWSATMDFVLAAFPWILIWGLNMRKMDKLVVCLAMSLGVLSGITAIIKTINIDRPIMRTDWTYGVIDVQIWSAAETAVVIMAASVPFLRPALKGSSGSKGSGNVRPGSRAFKLNRISTYKGPATDGGKLSPSPSAHSHTAKPMVEEREHRSSGGARRTSLATCYPYYESDDVESQR